MELKNIKQTKNKPGATNSYTDRQNTYIQEN